MQTADLAGSLAELNRRRMRVLAPLMAVLHVAHVALFHVSAAARATLSADVLRWRAGIVAAHAVMIPVALLSAAVFWWGRPRLVGIVGPLLAAAYLVHGALCSGFDQIVIATVTPYIGYCFGIAVIAALTPPQAVGAYLAGAITMIATLFAFQHAHDARFANLPNVVSANLVGVTLSWLTYAARKRDHKNQLTIARQAEELATLNASLERRVAEQVVQLQAQVVARSHELSLALQRIAVVRSDDYRLAVGTVLGGRFEIAQLLGEGGMGAVYRGVDKTSGARVAIKVIRATSTRQLDALHRFIREAGAAATLTHPAVVRMIHVDVSDEGLLYQVQELVDGETLTVHLGRTWPPGDAARLCAVLADALADAHARGVVHRDVKPDNVMLTPTAPGLKLLDFGIAKLYDAVTSSEHTTRGGGLVLGTPAFMAPEQVSGEGEVGDRADVYAVGLILFRLLTARGPFEASSPQEMMMRQVTVPAPDVRTIDAALPEALALLVARTLAKEPKQRPTAAELAAALDAFADAAGAAPLAKLTKPATGEVTVRARA